MKIKCHVCNTKNNKEALYCSNCAAKLNVKVSNDESEVPSFIMEKDSIYFVDDRVVCIGLAIKKLHKGDTLTLEKKVYTIGGIETIKRERVDSIEENQYCAIILYDTDRNKLRKAILKSVSKHRKTNKPAYFEADKPTVDYACFY